MTSHIKSLLKQLPFYGKTMKPRIKEFTNTKLSSELPFFEKPIEAKIKQLSITKLLNKQPFYKQPIKKPRVKNLRNHELLRELPFYDDINISRKERAFKWYAEAYKVEIINNKSLSDLLSVSKNSTKNLFDESLREKRSFKYILSTKVTSQKRINDNEYKPSTVYFNSLVKTIINRRFHLNDSFEEILYLLDIWINEISAWTIDQIDELYINTSNYVPLSGSSYIPFMWCFMWCHVRLINPPNSHPEKVNKHNKRIAANLNYSDIEFPLDINDY